MAIIVAVLYFAMIELLMIDSSRELAEARRFRARIVALTLAENAAERVALEIADSAKNAENANEEDEQGEIRGKMTKGAPALDGSIPFVIEGTGVSAGLESTRATVRLQGRLVGSSIQIEYAQHSQ
jgi:hypothetical protein